MAQFSLSLVFILILCFIHAGVSVPIDSVIDDLGELAKLSPFAELASFDELDSLDDLAFINEPASLAKQAPLDEPAPFDEPTLLVEPIKPFIKNAVKNPTSLNSLNEATPSKTFSASWPRVSTSDYISVANNRIVPKIIGPLKQFTLSAWVKDLRSKPTDSPMYWSYYTRDNKLAFYLQSHSGNYYVGLLNDDVTCPHPFTIYKEWHHIAVSWFSYSGSIAVYLDGERLACDKAVMKTGATIPAGYSHRMMLGVSQNASGVPVALCFTGDMAYVNMYSGGTWEENDIQKLMEHPTEHLGDILAWDQDKLTLHGAVTITEE